MNKELEKYFREKGRELAEDIYQELKSEDCVGADNEIEVERDNLKYNVSVTTFWEKAHWFELSVTGIDHDYLYKAAVIYF